MKSFSGQSCDATGLLGDLGLTHDLQLSVQKALALVSQSGVGGHGHGEVPVDFPVAHVHLYIWEEKERKRRGIARKRKKTQKPVKGTKTKNSPKVDFSKTALIHLA